MPLKLKMRSRGFYVDSRGYFARGVPLVLGLRKNGRWEEEHEAVF